MKKEKEKWKCKNCGEFDTRADFPKCPKCQSRAVTFLEVMEDKK